MIKFKKSFAKYKDPNGNMLDLGVLFGMGNFVTPQMFGAKGDGKTDDTAAIQAALDASSFVFIPDGTYMIDASYQGYASVGEGGIKPNNGQTIIMSKNATLKTIKL